MAKSEDNTSEDEVNYLDMSDEELDNLDIPEKADTIDETSKEDADVEDAEDTSDTDVENNVDDAVKDEKESTDTSEENTEESNEDTSIEESNAEEAKEDAKEDSLKETEDASIDVNFEEEYNKILAPFKANGKEIKVDSIDDAISLMAMGANYNKKMAKLKPSLKIVKMLENNDLLDENKLSFLIDLDKKNPDAVNKLIKDSGIDPLSVDVEKDTEYEPNTYTVDDKQIELDRVLDDIQDSPSFNDTANVIGNKWDETSKQIILDSPSIIRTINDHVASGLYEQISSVVESQRMLGKLSDVSDIEAYRQVGERLQASGELNIPTVPEAVKQTKSKATRDSKLINRKKAASLTKSATKSTSGVSDINPLSLSDEEFEKIASSKYM